MQKINQKYIKSITQLALREDLSPSGDITSKNIINKKVTTKIVAGQNCIIGGLNFVKEAFKNSDSKIIFKAKTKDGRKVKRGKVVAVLKGKALGILKSEKGQGKGTPQPRHPPPHSTPPSHHGDV